MHDQILDFEVTTNVPAAGQPADPDGTSTPVTTTDAPATTDGSAETPDAGTTTAEPARDELGKFRRRHRARSQAAGPDDVPRIQALTKKNRELQEQLDKFQKAPVASAPVPIPQSGQPAAAPAAPIPQTPPPVPQPPQPRPQGLPQTFPAFDAWQALQGNADKTYDDYTDARSDWRWLVNDQARRQMEAAHAAFTTRQTRIDAYEKGKVDARTKYPDFDTALNASPTISGVMVEALLAADKPAEVAYYLATHPEITTELSRDTINHDPSAYGPMKRLLDSFIVASATPSPPTAQHAADKKTGSALALVPQPAVPKPPNPVRTQAPVSADDELPGDDASLEDHERAFHKGGRRRR